jgi:uncharacterized protein YecE (DUF72 family)
MGSREISSIYLGRDGGVVELRIGCVGYSYPEWVGPFYPRHASQEEFLRMFGKVFDLLEIDSTFYRIPLPEMTREWRQLTPDGFSFTAKFPKVVTHELEFRRAKEPLARFFAAIAELRPKVKALLIQLAPSYTLIRGEEELFEFLKGLPNDYRYAVEFRHGSWFNETVYDELRKLKVAMAWSEVQYTDPPPVLTTDFVYLRFIGDRSLKTLGWVQIDRTPEMRKWLGHLRSVEDQVDHAYVFFNNHFAGFGPACVNVFRDLAGLPPVDFQAIHARERGQKRIVDF